MRTPRHGNAHERRRSFACVALLFVVPACSSEQSATTPPPPITRLELLVRGAESAGHVSLDAATSKIALCAGQASAYYPLTGHVEITAAPCDAGASCSLQIDQLEFHATNAQLGSTKFDDVSVTNDNTVSTEIGSSVPNAFSVLEDLTLVVTTSSNGTSTTGHFAQTSPLDGLYDPTNASFVLQGTYILESLEIEPGCK